MEMQILASLTGAILKKLVAQSWEHIGVDHRKVQNFRRTVSAIKALLLDAEKLNDQGHQLMRDWLGNLREALYDADDVLDEFHYHSLQHRVENFEGNADQGMLSRYTFSWRMSRKIKNVTETLNGIAANRSSLWLPGLGVGVGIVEKEKSHSYVHPSDVIGREHDKKVIIQHLDLSIETLSVIPIVGFEGIGKTAVAQLVCNDPWVAHNFKPILWVCVSNDPFNVEGLIKQIIDSAEGGNCEGISMEGAQIRLRNVLNRKRYLLILDDVWNDDRSKWLELERFLRGGRKGSKIIITTQSRSVAAAMGTVPMHELSCLSPEDSESLFTRFAFDNRAGLPLYLESTVHEIVKGCGGVPQLLKSTACSLYSVKQQSIWHSKRDTDHKLRLKGLPSTLRQCLALCSIFPTNFTFYNLRLIQLWIAEDFVDSSHPNEDLEDAGHRYMDILHSRCLLKNREPDYGDFFYLQIHSLIHQQAAQPEYMALNFDRNNIDPPETNIRHVSLSEDQRPAGAAVLSVLSSLGIRKEKVRTVLCPFVTERDIDESWVKTFIEQFKYMRVLDLSYSRFEKLPDSIGDLIHLRLLSLRNNIRLTRLPNSACKLYNLQTLVLLNCRGLQKLPRDTKNMISLRHLEITTNQKNFPELRESSSLQLLGIVGCVNLSSLFREGQNFPALRTLLIQGCRSLVSLLPSIKHLTALRTLKVADCEGLDLSKGDDGDDEFPGFHTLWFLVIVKLPTLVGLPRWILRTAASNFLQRIVIESCPKFIGLPQEVQQNFTIRQKFEIRN